MLFQKSSSIQKSDMVEGYELNVTSWVNDNNLLSKSQAIFLVFIIFFSLLPKDIYLRKRKGD